MTGYTSEMFEKRMNFKQFAILCARAFGATIMMRDDPLSTPIPEAFEPSAYNREAIAKAQQTLAELEGMTEKQRLAHGEKLKKETIDHHIKSLAEDREKVQFMRDMLANVEQWKPPTPDHERMKEFMREQLTESIRFEMVDYHEKELAAARAKSPLSFYNEVVMRAKRDIEYHTEEDRKEVERTNGRNAWVRQLRESLK